MYKSLKYLLLTCCFVGTAYGSSAFDSSSGNFEISGLPTRQLKPWFGNPETLVLISDVQNLVSKKNAEIQRQLEQKDKDLAAANQAAASQLNDLRQKLEAAEKEKQEMSLAFEQQLNNRLREQEEKATKEKEELLKIPTMLKEQADRERAVLTSSMENQQMLIELLKDQQKALLTAKTNAESDALAQQQRSGLLEQAVQAKENIIRTLEEKQRELETAARQKKELKEDFEINKKKVEELAAKENELEKKIEDLKKQKAEQEALIEQYKQAQQRGDYYTYLFALIKDRSVSDADLAQQIYATMIRSRKSLDAFHTGDQESLALALINVTRPYDATYDQAGVIKGSSKDKYRDRFRLLGNKIVELGFGADIDKICFEGSSLERLFGEVTTQFTNVSRQSNNHSSASSGSAN